MNYDLKLIDLTLPKEGFREFISSWILELNNKIYVVDPGPTKSLPILIEALQGRHPNFILLTHIHVDHAGGIGNLCKIFPEAKVIASELAHKHLIDPSKLIEGSTKTLGNLMDLYGEITPVTENLILKEIPIEIQIIKTPGHAPHHISFKIEDLIFCGEALGVIHSGSYLRPATPIRFNYEAYTSSIKNLSKIIKGKLCFGHYGSMPANSDIYRNALSQINLWIEITKKYSANEIFENLLKVDPMLRDFHLLPEDIKKREEIFIGNSIKGLIDLINYSSN